MFIKKICFLFLTLSLCVNSVIPSIISGSLIKIPDAPVAVENISVGDIIIGYHNTSLTTTQVMCIAHKTIDTVIAITTHKGTFYTSPDQLFYDPLFNYWIAAQDITEHTTFLDSQLSPCPCLAIEIITISPTKTFYISTNAPHTFFVSEQELLTHNVAPIIVISLAWLFGGGLKFAGLSIGAAALGTYIGVEVYNKQKAKGSSFEVVPVIGTCSRHSPDPDDDKDPFESIKLKADKKFRHTRFGKFYRDSQTKLWWTKDQAGHGGSAFKVFKESSKGLEWVFDADAVGNRIIGKHKGPVGIFIKYKDLISCP